MKHAISYLKALSLMLEARKRGNEADEDYLLDELDDIWLKLSRPELSLIKHISKYIARDLLSLKNLKKLITRLERQSAGPVAAVRVYRVQGSRSAMQKRSSITVYRLPGSVEIRRRSVVNLNGTLQALSELPADKQKWEN